MPIYEYRCTRCGAQIEVIQKINDPPLKRCRDCSGPLEKLVSRSSFQLKGSGWYVTDYGRKGSGETGSGKSKDVSKSTKGSDSTPSGSSSSSSASESKTSGTKSGSGD